MLRWTLIFLVLSIIAGIFGFTEISVASMKIAKIIFAIFLLLFCASGIMYLLGIK